MGHRTRLGKEQQALIIDPEVMQMVTKLHHQRRPDLVADQYQNDCDPYHLLDRDILTHYMIQRMHSKHKNS